MSGLAGDVVDSQIQDLFDLCFGELLGLPGTGQIAQAIQARILEAFTPPVDFLLGGSQCFGYLFGVLPRGGQQAGKLGLDSGQGGLGTRMIGSEPLKIIVQGGNVTIEVAGEQVWP